MKLGEFIEKFSHNNMIRLHYKIEGGYECVLKDHNEVSMDWEILKGESKNRHYVDNEVIKLVAILYTSGPYSEAINIVIEKLEDQPFVEDQGLDESENTTSNKNGAINGYHNDSFLFGLEDAIEQIGDEYDCCKLQFEGQEEKLKSIKMAFSRAISLIEDRMIQHHSKIKMNHFVDEFIKL